MNASPHQPSHATPDRHRIDGVDYLHAPLLCARLAREGKIDGFVEAVRRGDLQVYEVTREGKPWPVRVDLSPIVGTDPDDHFDDDGRRRTMLDLVIGDVFAHAIDDPHALAVVRADSFDRWLAQGEAVVEAHVDVDVEAPVEPLDPSTATARELRDAALTTWAVATGWTPSKPGERGPGIDWQAVVERYKGPPPTKDSASKWKFEAADGSTIGQDTGAWKKVFLRSPPRR